MAVAAPARQDAGAVHRDAGAGQGVLHGALQRRVVQAGDAGASGRMHQMDAGAGDSERQEGFYRGVNVNCVPIDNDVP